MFFGATPTTGAVRSVNTSVEPALLEAVTSTRRAEPMSTYRAVYSAVVARGMFVHSSSGSQRCHWNV